MACVAVEYQKSMRAAESFFMAEYMALRNVMRSECLEITTKAALRAQNVAVPGKRKRDCGYDADGGANMLNCSNNCKRLRGDEMDFSDH